MNCTSFLYISGQLTIVNSLEHESQSTFFSLISHLVDILPHSKTSLQGPWNPEWNTWDLVCVEGSWHWWPGDVRARRALQCCHRTMHFVNIMKRCLNIIAYFLLQWCRLDISTDFVITKNNVFAQWYWRILRINLILGEIKSRRKKRRGDVNHVIVIEQPL